jgi:hypothetical protein
MQVTVCTLDSRKPHEMQSRLHSEIDADVLGSTTRRTHLSLTSDM